jgi:hypothetical protein
MKGGVVVSKILWDSKKSVGIQIMFMDKRSAKIVVIYESQAKNDTPHRILSIVPAFNSTCKLSSYEKCI